MLLLRRILLSHRARSAPLGVLATFGAFTAVAAGARDVHAQTAAPAVDAAGAQQLFDEARALMNANDFAHACPKFAASQRKDPAAGTLLNLANCYEKNGQTASAWVTFKDAAAAARTGNHPEWVKRAQDKVAELAPRLVRLTVKLAPSASASSPPSLMVTRDGFTLTTEDLGTAVPVDPGVHHVDARADGKLPFHADVTVAPSSTANEVIIPALQDAPPDQAVAAPITPVYTAPATTTPADTNAVNGASDSSGATRRTVGIALAGAGVVALAVGTITGLSAISKNDSADKLCPTAGACNSHTAIDDESSAHSLSTVSTLTFIGGGALVAGGAVLYFLSPSHRTPASASAPTKPAWQAVPLIARGATGLAIEGGF